MAGAGLLHRPTDCFEGFPTALRRHPCQPQLRSHPGRYLWAGPQPTIGWGLTQAILEFVQQVRLQNRRALSVAAAQIAQSLRTVGVVARQQTLDPSSRIRHCGRDLGDVVPFGQKPDGLKVPRRSHVRAGPILLLQSRNTQMIRIPADQAGVAGLGHQWKFVPGLS